MFDSPLAKAPPIGFGLSSVALGTISLLLFFLPILGLPVALCGAGLGIVGIGMVALGHGTSLRWSVAGLVVSCVALSISILIIRVPLVHEPSHSMPRMWQEPRAMPYIAPPARPRP